MNDDNLNTNPTVNTDELNQTPEIENTPEESNLSDAETLKQSYENEVTKLQDSYTRLLAELVNTRKNIDLDKAKSKQGILLKIINIIDTYSIIISNHTESEEQNLIFSTLVNMIQELTTLLATENVTIIDIKVGDDFDASVAEVISTQEGDEDGKVMVVISPAYKIKDQILKTAKVIISKRKNN